MTITVPDLTLSHGSHADPDKGMCVVEAWAYLRGLPHSARPDCLSPALGAWLRSWNDDLRDDDERGHHLLRYVGEDGLMVGTPLQEQERARLALDWLIRSYAPALLDLVPGLGSHAKALRAIPAISDAGHVGVIRAATRAATRAADRFDRPTYDVRNLAATGGAAYVAAYSANLTATLSTRTATWAATDITIAAVRAAAAAAAPDDLDAAISDLQDDAHDCLRRMIEVTA